jgi:Big-like domain-containing protein
VSRILLAVLATLALAGGITASGADFTASSASPTVFTAAADFNTVAVALAPVGATLTGTVALSATASSDRGITSVKFQAAPAGTTDWVDLCTDTTSTYDCAWNTAALADGSYDVRALATDVAGYTRTSLQSSRTLDNFTLAASLADPGANISGTITLTATATAAAGGLQSLTIQQRAPGSSTWNDVCAAATTSPGTCSFNTTAYADGGRELRAVARDNGGAIAQTTVLTPNIDNSPPTASASIPASGTGTVTMTATASDSGSGIAYVAFEALYAGVWYEFCRDTTAPYTCGGDSAAVADGTYSIRVVVVNNAGVKTTGTPVSITIDNPPVPTDVQAGNALTAGLLESGDWVRLTWSETILPSSVTASWNGAGQAILAKVTDNGSNDQMEFYDASGTTRLNLTATGADLKLGGDFVSSAVNFNATMAQSGSSITITLGTQSGAGTLATAVAGTMTWKPSAGATDPAGHPSSTATVTETGAVDVDF